MNFQALSIHKLGTEKKRENAIKEKDKYVFRKQKKKERKKTMSQSIGFQRINFLLNVAAPTIFVKLKYIHLQA